MRRLGLGVVMALGCVGGAAPARTATLVVAADGSGDQPNIQAAIDAARDGDTILLADGRFAGPGNRDIEFRGKALTLRSRADDPAACLIDCAAGQWDPPHRGFLFLAGETAATRVAGVTILNGQAVGETAARGAGGAVLCVGASPLLENCVFRRNRAEMGGAVALDRSSARLVDCLFAENTAGLGGAVHCHDSSPRLESCRFVLNTADGGGGLHGSGGEAAVVDGVFDRNSASFGGGIMAVRRATLRVERCLLRGNYAILGGGALAQDARLEVRHSTLAVNVAGRGGGLFLREGGQLEIRNSVIAYSHQGEAVGSDETGRVEASCTLLFRNLDGDWIGPLANQQGVNGNRTAPPGFVDPAGGDFRFRSDSPCRQASAECDPRGWIAD